MSDIKQDRVQRATESDRKRLDRWAHTSLYGSAGIIKSHLNRIASSSTVTDLTKARIDTIRHELSLLELSLNSRMEDGKVIHAEPHKKVNTHEQDSA